MTPHFISYPRNFTYQTNTEITSKIFLGPGGGGGRGGWRRKGVRGGEKGEDGRARSPRNIAIFMKQAGRFGEKRTGAPRGEISRAARDWGWGGRVEIIFPKGESDPYHLWKRDEKEVGNVLVGKEPRENIKCLFS